MSRRDKIFYGEAPWRKGMIVFFYYFSILPSFEENFDTRWKMKERRILRLDQQ